MSKTNFDYATKTAELETIVNRLQDADTPLDEAMKLHAKGRALVTELETFLRTAENDIKKHLSES